MSVRYAHLLAEEKPPKENNRDIETSSKASFVSSATTSSHLTSERSHKPSFRPSDLTKEILDNIPTFDSKPSELNQFINTIETVANIYNIPEIQMVLLHTRGKSHEIITHGIEDDPAVGWEGIKRKLTSNYSATKSRMDVGIQLKNMAMKENETLGEYLARARTLFKAKLKLDMQWDEEYDPSDMWYVVNGLTLTHLKNCINKKLNTYKSYKQCFDHIEEEWEKTHYLDGEYTNQYRNGKKHQQTTHRNKHSRQRSMKYSRDMADTTTIISRATMARMATDPSTTDLTKTEMADSQATASTHLDTKAQQ